MKLLKVAASWLLLSLATFTFVIFASPMAGAYAYGTFVSAAVMLLGMPLHIFFATKYKDWSIFKGFFIAFCILAFTILVVAASGVFNFT